MFALIITSVCWSTYSKYSFIDPISSYEGWKFFEKLFRNFKVHSTLSSSAGACCASIVSLLYSSEYTSTRV